VRISEIRNIDSMSKTAKKMATPKGAAGRWASISAPRAGGVVRTLKPAKLQRLKIADGRTVKGVTLRPTSLASMERIAAKYSIALDRLAKR
jgi:hypothetical protein